MPILPRLATLVCLALAASVPASSADPQVGASGAPPCRVSGKLAPGMSASYELAKAGYAWLIFEAPVTDFKAENLNEAPGLEPFFEFQIKRLADGSFDQNFSSMIYLGDLTSPTTGQLVGNWKSTVTFGDVVNTYDNMNFRSSFMANKTYPSRLGGVGGGTTEPAEFIRKLEAGATLSFDARNEKNPAERVTASIDMTKAAEFFALMTQQDEMVRKQAAAGGCAPV
ncbi:MAG: hypothetical protein KDA53_05620 [Hyphomonas sp.]|nr:hypothetical protein [Hyphomonas sp.]